MVTGDEEIKYGYLLDPCFQIVNTAGKPLTSGWIEVYIAGTRNKYYCSSDFAGTLHPFKIPLDSLGSNIILADVSKSYDVYVYNRFGNLAMSRYNITPGKGGAGGSISGSGIAEHWIGKNGQNTSVPAGSDTALKLPTSFEYEGSFIDRINENRTAFYLKEGLYLVQAVVNFKQSDQSLTNEISQVDVFTRSDDAPEDMSFNRDMAGPDSSDDSHCLKVSFIRCVKEDDEVSQIVLFKVNTPNAWSECYLQNVQIARLSSGGAGAGGAIYTAGEYIAIDDETNTISVTGIEPENYATHDEVEQAIESATSAFITSEDLPDLSSYATEQWVLDKHYITSADIPDIPEDLVTSAELAQTSGLIEQDIADLTSAISEALADKMDKSSSADFYPRYDNPEGYLTSIPSEYVTESEMSGYVHEHTSAFITSGDIPPLPEDLVTSGELATVSGEIVNQIPSLDGYATEQYVQDYTSGFITSADLPDVSDMATKTWVTDQHYITSADVPPQIEYSAGDNIDITDHVVSVTDTSQLIAGDNVIITPSGNDYIISARASGSSGYVTRPEMDLAIEAATSGKQDTLTFGYDPDENITTINGHGIAGNGGSTYLPGQYISIDDYVITATGLQPSGEYLEPSDLNGYATETYVQSEVSGKADKSEIPSLEGYATETYVQDQTSAFITSADLPSEEAVEFEELDLSAYALASAIPDTSDMATKTWVGEQGYLTSVPSEYVTETELNSAVSGKADKSEIPSIQGLASETYVDEHIASATSGKADKSEIPSLDGYATETYVTEHTSAFITSAELPSEEEVEFEELDLSAYAMASAIPDVSNFVTQEDIDASVSGKMDATESSAFYPMATNPSGYLVSSDLNGFATEQYVQDQTSGFVDSAFVTEYVTSQTSGKQDTLTFEYNENSAISAINGSAIADISNVTTEAGQFTVHPNLNGADVTVIYPTDVAPVSAFYDLNAQYDDSASNRTGPSVFYYVFKSPGYDNDTWSANEGDVIQIKVNEAIQGLGSIIGFYAPNNSPASSSAPTINYPSSSPLLSGTGAVFTVEPGVYTTSLGGNPAGSSYGKYICLMVSKAGSGTYVDDILNKIEIKFGRPNSALGATVNLNRYYLGNTVNSSTLNSELACQLNVDSTTKQQKVYLPGNMPSSWITRVAQYVAYGSNRFSPGYYNTSQQYIAYKSSSNPYRYQYAFCTDHDTTNRKMTFLSYNESGVAIEKWTLDYSTYSTNVWTTTSLNGVTEQYVQDAIASGTSAFITSADLPDVSDMATQTWVGQQGYLTSVPSEYVTETELNSAVSGKADRSEIPSLQGYATEQYVQDQTSAFITSADLPDVSDMATKTWVGNQGYLTEVPSQYITESELTSAISGFATEQYVQDETSAFITSADLPSTEEVQFEELDTSNFVDSAYVTSYVATQTSGKQDQLSFEYNADNAISAINGSALAGGSSFDPSVLDAYIPYSAAGINLPNSNFRIDTSGQAYKITVPPYQNVSIRITKDYYPYPEGDGGLVWIQEALTAGTYELRTTASGAEFISSSIEDLDFEENLVNGVAVFTLDRDYRSGLRLGIYRMNGGLGEYVTTANASNTTLVKRVQEQTEEYLTTSDLNGYATESYVTSQTSGKQDALTFSYDSQSNITAIDGHGIAGGGGGGGVTEQYVQNAVASGTSGKLDTSAYTAPVNADWNSSAGLSEILNKPQSTQLLAGTGISISESGSNYVISSTAGSLVHDNTLSGYGTSAYPLGVVAQALYTAGILDVQYVNSLPASPTSNVLYLIPES